MKSRFDELLPFYVNGTLEESDRAWVDEYLREHPKSAAELQWYRTLQDTMQRDAPAVSAEVGLDKVMARIRGERAPSPCRGQAQPNRRSASACAAGWPRSPRNRCCAPRWPARWRWWWCKAW